MTISQKTAMDIALAYREVDTAEKLLAEISETVSRREAPDIRDAFGRHQDGLQLGVPSGSNGHRLFNVPWTMARPIIEAHISQQKSIIAVLSEKAAIEMRALDPVGPELNPQKTSQHPGTSSHSAESAGGRNGGGE